MRSSSNVRNSRLLMRIAPALLCIACTTGSLHAQQPEPDGVFMPRVMPPMPAGMAAPTNAALLYARALRLISPETLGAMGEKDPTADAPTERAIEAIEAYGSSLAIARRASRLEVCDWGIEYQQGPGALIDHAGPIRGLWRALDNEAAMLTKSDPDRAVENVIAMLAMAEHITQDRILISSLVGAAMTSGSVKRVNLLMDAGAVTRAQAPDLIARLQRVRATDLFRLREAMAYEKWTASEWLRAIGTGPEAGKRTADLLGTLVDDDSDALLDALALMDESQLAPLFDETARAYDDMVAALDSPEPAPELERISDAIGRGDYGVVAMRFSASLTRAYASAQRVTDEIDAAIKRLETLK